jgi:FixJ family two-component response regulator
MLRAAGYGVAVHTDPAAFLAMRPTPERGCIVTDLHMPAVDGLELQTAVLAWERPIPIIFLSGHADVRSTVAAVRSGAEDYLLKPVGSADLISAIERALERDSADRIVHSHREETRVRFARLTPREREVLWHLLRGDSIKRTAQAMGITDRSVIRHRTRLKSKLEVESTAELVRMASEVGLR